MTRREFTHSYLSFQNVTAVIGILGAVWITARFLVPLSDVPMKMEKIESTQIVLTESLKTLAEVAKDSKEMRRDVDRHEGAIQTVIQRLDRLER